MVMRDADPVAVDELQLGDHVDTADSLGSGQLQVTGARDTFLTAGRFDPAATIELLAGRITEARDRGWAGLRLVGDMGWALGTVPGVEHLDWYEAQVNLQQLLRIRRIFDPPGLRLIGEADLSNRRALATVLTTLIDQPSDRDRPLVIDIGELRFADGAAASLMVRAAAASRTGMRIIGRSPALARLLEMVGAGAVARLTVSGRGPH